VSDVIEGIVISLGSESDASEEKSESNDGNGSDLSQPLPTEPSRHRVA
jgi:hypothetical protein